MVITWPLVKFLSGYPPFWLLNITAWIAAGSIVYFVFRAIAERPDTLLKYILLNYPLGLLLRSGLRYLYRRLYLKSASFASLAIMAVFFPCWERLCGSVLARPWSVALTSYRMGRQLPLCSFYLRWFLNVVWSCLAGAHSISVWSFARFAGTKGEIDAAKFHVGLLSTPGNPNRMKKLNLIYFRFFSIPSTFFQRTLL